MTRPVDTHCHLQAEQFDADREEVLSRALDELEWLVVIGDGVENARKALALSRDRVYATVGFHPYQAADCVESVMQAATEIARHLRVVAVGEIGLDYYNEFAPRQVQAEAFERQLEWACGLGMPVVVHNREADRDVHAMLTRYVPRLPSCIMHCFGSSASDARDFVELGCYISFAGNVTFPKAQPLRDAAAVVPLDRLLVETDAPYLAPQPYRGKRCEPHFVTETLRVLAQLRGVDYAALAAQTTANAHAAYHIPPMPA